MTAAAAAADPVEAASLTAPLVEVNTEVVAMVAALPVRVAARGRGGAAIMEFMADYGKEDDLPRGVL